MNAQNVLLVEDDTRFRERLARALTDRGWNVLQAGDPDSAIALASEHLLDLAIVDLRLGTASGVDAVKALHEADAETLIFVLTGYGSIATAVASLRSGATDYLTKPTDADQLLAAYEKAKSGIVTDNAQPTVPSLDQVEWEHIHRVLTDCDGNITHAAKLLGVHRRSLQRKLSKRPLPSIT